PQAEEQMAKLIEIISSIRNTRSQWNIKNQEKINCHFFSSDNGLALIEDNRDILKSLTNIDEIVIEAKDLKLKDAAVGLVSSIKFAIPLGDLIDIDKEKKRILSEI
ncbi:hypothetical protein RZS08_49165, partial [Arthrospira platensis SPKY1]|nr:hypothetical protein [Arthrospira platensis SPKY1]